MCAVIFANQSAFHEQVQNADVRISPRLASGDPNAAGRVAALYYTLDGTEPGAHNHDGGCALRAKYGACQTVKSRFWPWLPGKSFKVFPLRSEALYYTLDGTESGAHHHDGGGAHDPQGLGCRLQGVGCRV